MKYKVPECGSKMFSCPHCGALAQQEWRAVKFDQDFIPGAGWQEENPQIARCLACGKKSFWNNGVMVFPYQMEVPECNPDMPEEVLTLYREASLIVALSPRAACALLRLAIAKLFACLKYARNESASYMEGFADTIHDALDTVRITGNNAVPAGEIQADGDTTHTATILFGLLNLIVEYNISSRRKANDLYLLLPHEPNAADH